jgi:hypothetical protein
MLHESCKSTLSLPIDLNERFLRVKLLTWDEIEIEQIVQKIAGDDSHDCKYVKYQCHGLTRISTSPKMVSLKGSFLVRSSETPQKMLELPVSEL